MRRPFTVMYWSAGIVAAILVVATVVVVYRVGWGGGTPYFRQQAGSFVCLDKQDQPQDSISITYSDDGRTAVIKSAQSDATLEFQGGGLVRDLFRGEGVELVVDPEIFVRGLDGRSRGPCVWQSRINNPTESLLPGAQP